MAARDDEGGGIGEGRKMTGLNLKRLSLIPSGGKERGCVAALPKFAPLLDAFESRNLSRVSASRAEGRGGENNKVFTVIRHEL